MARTNENGELEANEIETAGVITDAYGNRWTLPTDPEVGEDFNFVYNPVHLPKTDPRFHYQFERTDRLGWAMSEQFVPVRRSEVGLAEINDANIKLQDYGIHNNDGLDPVHTIGDLTLVKIPKQLHARRVAAAQAEADRAKNSIEPPKNKNIEDAKASLKSDWEGRGQKVQEEAIRSTTYVKERKQ